LKETQHLSAAFHLQVQSSLSTILTGIRHSARHFVRTPGVSLALLFTIALGVGSNVAIHGFVRGMTKFNSPLAFDGRVVSIFRRDAHREAGPLSYADYRSLGSHPDPFEWIGAARIIPAAITVAGQSQVLSVAAVTPGLAGFFNLTLDQGVVISHRIWESAFSSKTDLSGEQIHIDGLNLPVVGVAPDWLEGVYRDRAVDLWKPFKEQALEGVDPGSRNFWVLGKRRGSYSINEIQTAVRGRPSGPAELRVLPYTGTTPEVGEGRSRVGALLSFAGVLVFFIACSNVAAFLVGRASARSHETSIRVALGASRGQLARGLLSDSIVISVTGGALGMLLAFWTSLVLPSLLFEEDAQRLVFAPDLFSIVAASAACVGITIVCGLLPVLVTSHDRPADVLRRESAGPSIGIRHLRVGLVIAQMTSCCLLVISTAFLFAGLRTALQTSVAHRLRHPILVSVLASSGIGGGPRYFQNVQEAAPLVAGVSPKAWTARLPGDLPAWVTFRVEPRQLPLRDVTLDVQAFAPSSSTLFALPPVAGRLFGVEHQTCRSAMVNEEAAKKLFGPGTVGRSIRDAANFPVEIIGVLAMPKAAHAATQPAIYFYQEDQKGPHAERLGLANFRAPIVSNLEQVELDSNVVSPSYFAVMGWPLTAGQLFPDDPNLHGCRVGVVNQEAADLYFNGNAVGRTVIDDSGRRAEIIGVVHSAPLGTFERRVEPAIYFPMARDFTPYMTLILGALEVSAPLLADLDRGITAVPGRGPSPVVVKTLETYLNQTALAPLRIATMIIGASATVALILSIFGLFGALSDAVRQRRREFAVRIALGAQRRHVIAQVLQEGLRLAAAGAVAGTFGSLLLSRTLAGIIPGNGSPAIWVWMAAPLLLAASVTLASVLPARRALIVNPLTIMRDD
jgi:ABC-type antimicrobial peptide transport system permease subunit